MQNRLPSTFPASNKIPKGLYRLFESNSIAILLNNNANPGESFEWMAGFGKKAEINCDESENAFDLLKEFLGHHKDHVFGHFSYDLKNAIEQLHSSNPSGIKFPSLYFFVPELIAIKKDNLITSKSSNEILEKEFLEAKNELGETEKNKSEINLLARTSKEVYLKNVTQLLNHIHRGDIYEINYCMEFFAENCSIDPIAVYERLTNLTDAPFSTLYKNDGQWLICGSPERFMQKKGNKIISQPIKGTRSRGKNEAEDNRLKEELRNDSKELSENVMIVDLVRNDLSRSAKKGTVKVDELFSIHSFKSVHQMISTVSCELDEKVHPVDAIKNAFPMGSMTGAPKIRAMELAEEFEQMKRGLYSGAVGYFTPAMDFDFNVVIRSIQYNSNTGYLSLMVGSAITANSIPEKEYEECLLKAESLFLALGLQPKD